MRKTIIAIGAVAALGLGFAAPAQAATVADPPTTFALTGNELPIGFPAVGNLGALPDGGPDVSGQPAAGPVLAAPVPAGTVAAPVPAGTVAAPVPAGTVAAPAPAGTVAAPAPAGTVAAPATTFTLAGGELSIGFPALGDLGARPDADPDVSGQPAPVTVVDARGPGVASWAAVASSTAFTTAGAPPAAPVTDPARGSSRGPARGSARKAPAATAGKALSVPVTGNAPGGAQTVYSSTALLGNNSSTWDPKIIVTAPVSTVIGLNPATIVHSVY